MNTHWVSKPRSRANAQKEDPNETSLIKLLESDPEATEKTEKEPPTATLPLVETDEPAVTNPN